LVPVKRVWINPDISPLIGIFDFKGIKRSVGLDENMEVKFKSAF